VKHAVAVLTLFSLGSSLFAQNNFWRDDKGNPIPDTESRRSVSDFGGWLVVTPDKDWQAKWNAPWNTIPHFNEASTVEKGKQVFILTFFSNPKLSERGTAEVTCDIDVTRPDGTSSIHQVDLVCLQGALRGKPSNVYLSAPILNFTGEPKDPAGEWLVRILLKDNVRHVSLPLKTSFILQ
jgi:hypothetical protein